MQAVNYRFMAKPLRLAPTTVVIAKALIHLGVLAYLGSLFWLAVLDKLGADPVKALLHQTGVAAIVLLLVSLTLSPLARHLPCGDLIKFRRLVGLYAFFAALVHITTYIAFEIQLDFALVLEDIVERPYITVGFIAFVILLVLAITSPMAIRKRLKRNWQRIHNGVYVALILGLLHFSWSVKTALQDPLIYWLIGLTLLSHRVWLKAKKRK